MKIFIIKSEVKYMVMYVLENFEFLLGMTIWYDILFTVNSISKNFQSEDIHIDVTRNQLKGLFFVVENYRENKFVYTLISTKEIANEKEVVPKFHGKCVIYRKKQFDENVDDDKTQFVEESFRINYFLYMVNQVISSLRTVLSNLKCLKLFLGFCLISRN